MSEQKIKKIEREFEGIVVSKRMDKTAVVLITRTVTHKRYKKQYKMSRRYKVHDEKNECREGNLVRFRECRPMSKEKRWRLIQILK
ncbi:30S ribosomal protein S17 [Candidatus Falkowbacteria bacterium]|nr:30S ribosomal protein S17 [Candidatus Falkowbacteria bacterium]